MSFVDRGLARFPSLAADFRAYPSDTEGGPTATASRVPPILSLEERVGVHRPLHQVAWSFPWKMAEMTRTDVNAAGGGRGVTKKGLPLVGSNYTVVYYT
jgi:hypothetical protein